MILKSEPAAAPKIGGVEPTHARAILSAPAASTSGGANWNVENSTLYGASLRAPVFSSTARMPSFWTPTRRVTFARSASVTGLSGDGLEEESPLSSSDPHAANANAESATRAAASRRRSDRD